jgi:hypothetical protein
MLLVQGDIFQGPGNIFSFDLIPDRTVGHPAVMTTFRQTGIRMDEKFGRGVGLAVDQGADFRYLSMDLVQIEIVWKS